MAKNLKWPLILALFFSGSLKGELPSAAAGEQLFRNGLFLDAAERYREALEQEASPALRLRLAHALILGGAPQEALKELDPSNPDPKALFLRGRCALLLGRHEEAAQLLAAYGESDDIAFLAESRYDLGVSRFQLGALAEAKAALAPLADENATLLLARIALKERHIGEALEKASSLTVAGAKSFIQGEASFLEGDYLQAISHYINALSKKNSEDWEKNAHWNLILSYLHLGQFEQAHKGVLLLPDDEARALLSARCHLAEAEALGKESSYQQARALLNDSKLIASPEGKREALYLSAQAAPSYGEREGLYAKLTSEENRLSPAYAQGWLLRGANALAELRRRLPGKEESSALLATAASSFKRAFALFNGKEEEAAARSLLQLAEAYSVEGSLDSLKRAHAIVSSLIEEHPSLAAALEQPGESHHLRGLLSLKIAEKEGTPSLYKRAIEELLNGLALYPQSRCKSDSLRLLGSAAYRCDEWARAQQAFTELLETPHRHEALFWLAAVLEKSGGSSAEVRTLREKLYREHPGSPLAGEAYFRCWSLRDYLHGEREAFDHLQKMESLFPGNPYLIYRNYLLGLSYKRERKESEGRLIQKRSLPAAIDCFQKVEELYTSLSPEQKEETALALLYYRSTLERAKANLAIGEQSLGAKKVVYNDYAVTLLEKLCGALAAPANQSLPFHEVEEESLHWLATAYQRHGALDQGEKLLEEVLKKYQAAKVTRGYYLSRSWALLGHFRMEKGRYSEALEAFAAAEDAAKGKVATADEQLDLWLQKSECLRRQGNLSEAMKQLSLVINKDLISTLRLKAMFLRAELYEEQGRPELARRQLEALANKGGPWARQAQDKLKQHYGCTHEDAH